MNRIEASNKIGHLDLLIFANENKMQELEKDFKQDWSARYKHDQLWLQTSKYKKERNSLVELTSNSLDENLTKLLNEEP
jgi:DNA phosphorothioation-dependent restriction protein DptG